MNALVVGQVLGRYELLLPIAKGGMAQVWAARLRGTRGFQKIVAIKTILAGAMDDDRMEQMFLEEASLASQIHHPNVVGTLELGEENGLLYLVMEWVDGESANFVMNRAAGRNGIPLPIAVNLIGQACKGLHAAHDLRDESGELLGVVHRDISAQNVLVTYSGNAKLVDFGIAKATARASGLTEAGEIKGKFAYLAPEQVLSQPIDRRTDIFGMGTLLYFLTTGRHPFKGTNPGETLHRICSGQPTAPSDIVRDYPRELETVVCKALNKVPDERWATANDMLSALERAMPQCLDGSFEVKVAEYMSQLLGNRSRERRTELRLAQQMLDGSGAKHLSLDTVTGSSGSLRAISVEPTSAKSIDDNQSQRQTAAQLTSHDPAIEVSAGSKRRPMKYAVAACVLALGGILLFASRRPWARGSDGDRRAQAASPVPATLLGAPVDASMAEPEARAAPNDAAPVLAASATNDGLEATTSKGVRKGPASPPRPMTAATAPAPSGPPPPPVERARDSKSNAWDPGSFGGRR